MRTIENTDEEPGLRKDAKMLGEWVSEVQVGKCRPGWRQRGLHRMAKNTACDSRQYQPCRAIVRTIVKKRFALFWL